MATNNLLVIAGHTCPAPTDYDVELSDLDSAKSGRGCTGYMTRERIRHGIVKISVKWTMLNNEDAGNLINWVSADHFTVNYNIGNAVSSADMYCASQKVHCKCVPTSGDYRWDIEYSLIEM